MEPTALYLHGLYGEPNPGKIGYLEDRGFRVVGPHYRYEDYTPDLARLLEVLEGLHAEHRFALLVGNSFGGMLCYHLSRKNGIPAILFNPAVNFTSITIHIPEYTPVLGVPRLIVLGLRDNHILPADTKAYLQQPGQLDAADELLEVPGLGHRVPVSVFIDLLGTHPFLSRILGRGDDADVTDRQDASLDSDP